MTVGSRRQRQVFSTITSPPFSNLRLEFPELFKFVEFHSAAGSTVLELKLRFKLNCIIDTIFWCDDEAFYINSGAPTRIGVPNQSERS